MPTPLVSGAPRLYLGGMAIFPRPATPKALWQDVRAFVAQRQRHELVFGVLSVAITAAIVFAFYVDSRVKPPPPEPVFVQSWPESRSDAEIIAQQKIDQARRDAKAAKRQAAFQRLADRLGIE
ncbi:MAG TPA: hypothetical protein VNQ31_05005 [Sphingomonadaceae bacterium]|jgi:hypothetical protein|nr:hypothetical protein [Sphingomonadaceae bacterium]